MVVSLVTLTGDIADLVGDNFDSRRTKVWLEANTDFVVDEDNQRIRLGTAVATVGEDGSFTFTDLLASDSPDVNPSDFQYRLHVDYMRASDRQRREQSFGWVSVTADTHIVDLIEEQYVEPSWQSNLDATVAAQIEDGDSDTSVALSASYARFTDEDGDPIPDKQARIIFDSTGFPVDIVLEDAS